jgi:hypothetical protein
MAKKIILGLIITAVISLTSFGAIYAYQKEKLNLEKINGKEYGINYSSNGHQAGKCSESVNKDGELECPKNEERIRNNFRYREEECEDCSQQDAVRNEYQHRYENEYNEDCDQDCEENEKNFQNQNEKSNRRARGKNS